MSELRRCGKIKLIFLLSAALGLVIGVWAALAFASPNLVQTQGLQQVTEVGATTTKQCTIDNSTAGQSALALDVTSSAGTGVVQSWAVDGTQQLTYGLFLGAFYGFAQPNSTSNIFFGMADASDFILIDGNGGTITINGGTGVSITATTVASLTNSSLTSGRVVLAGASGINQDDADLTFATDTLTVDKMIIDTATVGSVIQTLRSAATNDDPVEEVEQNRAATTDATVTTIDTIAIPASTTLTAECRVVARRTGGTAGTAEDGAAYVVRGAWKNVAGTATLIGAVNADYTAEDQAAWDATFAVSGGNALLQVTAALNNNVTWHSTCRVSKVST